MYHTIANKNVESPVINGAIIHRCIPLIRLQIITGRASTIRLRVQCERRLHRRPQTTTRRTRWRRREGTIQPRRTRRFGQNRRLLRRLGHRLPRHRQQNQRTANQILRQSELNPRYCLAIQNNKKCYLTTVTRTDNAISNISSRNQFN